MVREDAHLAQILGHTVAGAFLNEKALEPLGRHLVDQRFRIARRTGDSHGGIVDVGREDLDPWQRRQGVHVLAQQNGDEIDFFARGASRYPDPNLVIGPLAFEQRGYDQGLKGTKSLGIAEKIGDPDQQVPEQGTDLIRVFLEPTDVVLEVCRLDHLHAALDPTLKGLVFVLAEIVRGPRAQQCVDLGQDDRPTRERLQLPRRMVPIAASIETTC